MNYFSKWLIFVLLGVSSVSSKAQNWEFGVNLGASNYQGDLAPDIALNETHWASGLFVKRNWNEFFSLYFGANQGTISGDDANYSFLQIRGLNFESTITEVTTYLEFNFFPFSLGLNPSKFTPYVFSGLSIFRFEPVATYNGETIKLRTLDTEGKVLGKERKNTYSPIQPAIPLGGGFKMKLSKNTNISVFLGFRATFTDYLDDVSTVYYDAELLANKYGSIAYELSDRSPQKIGFMGKQRGREDLKDWYIFSGISISYSMKKSVCYEF